MTIITSSIKQQQLVMKFYNRLFQQSLKRETLQNIVLMLLNNIKNNSIVSSYKSCTEMLKANNINHKDNGYTESFTALKKLGIILKHDNRYLLNPAVEAKYTSRRYQLIIEYYNLLFKDTAFELTTLDELRNEAVYTYFNNIAERNEKIEFNNCLYEKFGSPKFEYIKPLTPKSFDEVYNIAFNTPKPKLLSEYDKPIYKSVNESYRHVCSNQVTALLIHHIYILEEQGLVTVQWGGKGTPTNYLFHRLTVKVQKALVSYDQTKYYLDNLPVPDEELAAQLFEDTQQQVQLQFEEEEIMNQSYNDESDQQSIDLPESEPEVTQVNIDELYDMIHPSSLNLKPYYTYTQSQEDNLYRVWLNNGCNRNPDWLNFPADLHYKLNQRYIKSLQTSDHKN
ncbi:MAG: hypothetical protein AAFQ80_15125 [Cyanobacteria bacterium J06621_8]